MGESRLDPGFETVQIPMQQKTVSSYKILRNMIEFSMKEAKFVNEDNREILSPTAAGMVVTIKSFQTPQK